MPLPNRTTYTEQYYERIKNEISLCASMHNQYKMNNIVEYVVTIMATTR